MGSDDALDSDADASGLSQLFSLSPGQALSGIDAGVVGTLPGFGFALGLGSQQDDEGRVIATDAAGNVYVTGFFRGETDFDPGPGSSVLDAGRGGDVFIAKYTRLGALVWARQIGGDDYLYARGLKIANNGDVLLAGSYGGAVDFDPGPGRLVLETASVATFLARLDADGNLVWARSLDASSPTDLALGPDGDLFLTGRFSGTGDFDPGPDSYPLSSAGGADAYVVKLNESGELIWARAYGGTDDEYAERIAVDTNGAIYLTGYFESTADFDPGPCACSLTSAGYTDIFAVRLDATGDLVWAGAIGGTANDYGAR